MNTRKKIRLLLILHLGLVGFCFATRTIEEVRNEIDQLQAQVAKASQFQSRLFIFGSLFGETHTLDTVKKGIQEHESLEKYIAHNETTAAEKSLSIELLHQERLSLEKETNHLYQLNTKKNEEFSLNIGLSDDDKKYIANNNYEAYCATDEGKAALIKQQRYDEAEHEIQCLEIEKNACNDNVRDARTYQMALECLSELGVDETEGATQYAKYQEEEKRLRQDLLLLYEEKRKLNTSTKPDGFVPSSARRTKPTRVDRSTFVSDDVETDRSSPFSWESSSDDHAPKDLDDKDLPGETTVANEKSHAKWIIGASSIAIILVTSGITLKKYLDARKKEEEEKKKKAERLAL